MDGASAGAGSATPGARPTGPAGSTRRDLARGLRACALAAALAPALTALRRPPSRAAANAPHDSGFDVTHRGRRIQGARLPARGAAEDVRWHVTVDGRPLHLMRRADGTWLSMVDHYCSYPTPLDAARAAVDALGPGRGLRAAPAPAAGEGHHPQEGGRHGVRA
ncbi:tyrosinase family oxidase copper chaperone [Streptomyces sp. NPDC052309]|uniref:tyrosinase family oxidase copper chaperone n=1 Tax=Streptomyces sp. NPDC052309 TaxID=3155421 RepID=UPI00342A6871